MIIKVDRPGYSRDDEHVSETALDYALRTRQKNIAEILVAKFNFENTILELNETEGESIESYI